RRGRRRRVAALLRFVRLVGRRDARHLGAGRVRAGRDGRDAVLDRGAAVGRGADNDGLATAGRRAHHPGDRDDERHRTGTGRDRDPRRGRAVRDGRRRGGVAPLGGGGRVVTSAHVASFQGGRGPAD